MNEAKVKLFLTENLGFTNIHLDYLDYFHNELILYNKKYNLISKSTVSNVWYRHILDSAQIIKFISFQKGGSVSDLGTGAGFPGLIVAIYAKNKDFHVKLYEKSPVKNDFLNKIIKHTGINCEVIGGNCNEHYIDSDYIVARAFKKLDKVMSISRGIAKKPHKIIILKGKNAQVEVNNALKTYPFKYKLVDSITDEQSKIVLVDIIKND